MRYTARQPIKTVGGSVIVSHDLIATQPGQKQYADDCYKYPHWLHDAISLKGSLAQYVIQRSTEGRTGALPVLSISNRYGHRWSDRAVAAVDHSS